MKADAWATALNALGPELGLSIANEHEISVIYIIKSNNEIIFQQSNWWIF
jgi:thiamine biosynthesis lipoprotein ApbE